MYVVVAAVVYPVKRVNVLHVACVIRSVVMVVQNKQHEEVDQKCLQLDQEKDGHMNPSIEISMV